MKIYTRTGDDGSTGLVGGSRVRKSDPRIGCYGAVDELNAALGLAAVTAPSLLRIPLQRVQGELFIVGADLATPTGAARPAGLACLSAANIQKLEAEIDAADAIIEPIRNFVLPGGSETAARMHLARTICRRAERLAVSLSTEYQIDATLLTYLNRLSDWLFVQARWSNRVAGIKDIPWSRGDQAP